MFWDTPNIGGDVTSWGNKILRLMVGSGADSRLYTMLLAQLPPLLERLHWEFAMVQKHYSIAYIRSQEESSATGTVGFAHSSTVFDLSQASFCSHSF